MVEAARQHRRDHREPQDAVDPADEIVERGAVRQALVVEPAQDLSLVGGGEAVLRVLVVEELEGGAGNELALAVAQGHDDPLEQADLQHGLEHRERMAVLHEGLELGALVDAVDRQGVAARA